MKVWNARSAQILTAAMLAAVAHSALANSAIVYYKPATSWSVVDIHYGINGKWTAPPGVAMDGACTGWKTKTIDLGTATTWQVTFNNGSGKWDNNGGRNYTLGTGVLNISGGVVSTGNPCDTSPDKTATVYYKPAANWSAVDIHYGINGSWTTPPGVPMTKACSGWYTKTVSLGSATGFAVTFNNASGTWDNNGGRNYQLGSGIVTVASGVIGTTNPCGTADTTAPSVPANLKTTATTTTTISLSWTASTDDTAVTGYTIYRDGKKAGTSATPSFTDTNLAAGTTYSYTIDAYDAATNTSAQSTPALSASTQQGTINNAEVYYYTGTKGWSSVNIHYGLNGVWTTPPGVAMNEVGCTNWVKKTVNMGTNASMKTDFNNGSTWDNNNGVDYTLVPGVTKVKDGVVTANAASPCVIDVTPPTTPTDLKGTAEGTNVTLNWGASTDPESPTISYVITRTGGSGTQTFNATTNTYVDTSGAPRTTYQYSVVAKNETGLTSTPCNTISVTTGDQSQPPKTTFSWDNATVYFVLTDRFVNGDTNNDRSYGRESDKNGVSFGNKLADMPSAFHGGDLKGLLQKINEGYFTKLGVNAIWMTAPYEQIHGFVGGDGNHKHYGYHGYYALDFSSMDKNMGSREDLQAVVDAAHAQGIRIVLDVVMNHSGYENLKDMYEFGFGGLNNGWEGTAFRSSDSVNYDADIGPFINKGDSKWSKWWGADWLRVSNGLAGYSACNGTDGLTGCTGYLPDFLTDSPSTVGIPPVLQTKWTREGTMTQKSADLDAWFARTGRPRTVPNYLVKWLTDYVRDLGIDGFRCDTAKHVELSNWKILKEEAQRARRDWIAANPAKAALLSGDTEFWMTGEKYGHGTERDDYFDNGFDSMINFNFQGAAGNLNGIESTYATLAGVNADNSKPYNLLSYISSHDKGLFNRSNLKNGMTALLMAPGGAQIFYGDETARPLLSCCGDHAWRGDMNWSSPNTDLLTHAQKLGKFRNAHVAVGAGSHRKLADSPYTFARVKDLDKVVVAFGAVGRVQINVGSTFADGTLVRDAYTGITANVSGGTVSITADTNGVVLLEDAATTAQ